MSKPFAIVTGAAGVLGEQHRKMAEPGSAKKAKR
jgi:hypothetical protein